MNAFNPGLPFGGPRTISDRFSLLFVQKVGAEGRVAMVALACDATHAYVALRREHDAVVVEGDDREALGVLVVSLQDCAVVARLAPPGGDRTSRIQL
jgi:hypothetical protein